MPPAAGFALFASAIGHCGIAWGEGARTIVGTLLPEGNPAATGSRMQGRFPGVREVTPPASVQLMIDRIQASLDGNEDDLRDLDLDMDGVPAFHQRVYAFARTIKPGLTLSYGEVAAALGEPGASRAVGQALGHNPFAPVVPCHRILAAGNRSGGFSAGGGVATKLKMLEREGAWFGTERGLF